MTSDAQPPSPQTTPFGTLLRTHRESRNYAQDKLSIWAGLGKNAVGRIERGEREAVTFEVVQALADVLNLKGILRQEFIATAGFLPEIETPTPPQHFEGMVENFYSNVYEYPAFVYDEYFDLHSINSYMIPLFRLELEHVSQMMLAPHGRNILYQLFHPAELAKHQADEEAYQRWFHSTTNALYRFRVNMLGKTQTERYQEIINAMDGSEKFQEVWKKIEKPDFQPEKRPLPAQIGPFNTTSGLKLSFYSIFAQLGIDHHRFAPGYSFLYYWPVNSESQHNLQILRSIYPYKVYFVDDAQNWIKSA
jgi:transcriptional regulator with XRE-family HTH domain